MEQGFEIVTWPEYKRAKDLVGTIFPEDISENVILTQARKHGIGKKMGRCYIFSPDDCSLLYEVLPCPSNSNVDRRSPYWIIRGTLRGIRVEESTGTSDRSVAEEIRAKSEAEILEQSVYGRRATATFAHAAVSYLGNGGSKRFTGPVIGHFGTTPLVHIDQDALDAGAKKLFPHASPATRNRQFFAVASAILHHAAKRGWCPSPLIQRPRSSDPRIRWITIEEADRLIKACSDHLRPLVIFMLYTGARIGEALWLDWRDVDLGRAHVSFPKTKNGEARGVPLHPRVVAALANLKGQERRSVSPTGRQTLQPS